MIQDIEKSGLQRIVLDRKAFFAGSDLAELVSGSKSIYIHGVALAFLAKNKRLTRVLEEIASTGGTLEILLAHPASEIVAYRDKEERWGGKLAEEIQNSLEELRSLQKKYPQSVKLYLFRGEIHNTLVCSDKGVVVSPYVFGKKGWFSPVLIFDRTNEAVVSAFEEQRKEIFDYAAAIDPNTLTSVE